VRKKQNGVDDNINKDATDILVVARVAAAAAVAQDIFFLYTTGIDIKDGIDIDIDNESASLSLRPVSWPCRESSEY